MARLVYDVAVTLDGYISGPDGDISAFPAAGDHVDAYLERLQGYRTVVMGRNTYEFGYAYGLEPGRRAYPHMQHVIFSTGIELPDDSDVRVERDPARWLAVIDTLKAEADHDIYLCGGGRLAGCLLERDRIDRLIVKLAPVVIGGGVPLFDSAARASFSASSALRHDSGVVTIVSDRIR